MSEWEFISSGDNVFNDKPKSKSKKNKSLKKRIVGVRHDKYSNYLGNWSVNPQKKESKKSSSRKALSVPEQRRPYVEQQQQQQQHYPSINTTPSSSSRLKHDITSWSSNTPVQHTTSNYSNPNIYNSVPTKHSHHQSNRNHIRNDYNRNVNVQQKPFYRNSNPSFQSNPSSDMYPPIHNQQQQHNVNHLQHHYPQGSVYPPSTSNHSHMLRVSDPSRSSPIQSPMEIQSPNIEMSYHHMSDDVPPELQQYPLSDFDNQVEDTNFIPYFSFTPHQPQGDYYGEVPYEHYGPQ